MGQTNSIAGPTVFIIFAGIVVCMTEGLRSTGILATRSGTSVRFQEQFEKIHKVLILTCKIDTGTLPISFYNHEELLARCCIIPSIKCESLLGNKSSISFDSNIKQYTLMIWGLNNDIGNWSCSHGGRNDASSSVLIEGPVEPSKGPVEPSACKGPVEPSACKGPVEPIACKESSKTDETSYLVLITFVISFLVVWIIIIVIEERTKKISSPGMFFKCNAKLLSGIKVCSTCTLLISVIIVAYVLDNTTAHKIVGCCLATFLGCCLPICLQLKPCTSDGTDGIETQPQVDTSPCLPDLQVDDQSR